MIFETSVGNQKEYSALKFMALLIISQLQVQYFKMLPLKYPLKAAWMETFAIDYAPPILQLVFTSRYLKFKAQIYVAKLFF